LRLLQQIIAILSLIILSIAGRLVFAALLVLVISKMTNVDWIPALFLSLIGVSLLGSIVDSRLEARRLQRRRETQAAWRERTMQTAESKSDPITTKS